LRGSPFKPLGHLTDIKDRHFRMISVLL
jgi:hypothetical protein